MGLTLLISITLAGADASPPPQLSLANGEALDRYALDRLEARGKSKGIGSGISSRNHGLSTQEMAEST